MEEKKITQEDIDVFINGHDPMERIVGLDYKGKDNFITVIYRNEKDQKCIREEPFMPFCWATHAACLRLCDGDKAELGPLMKRYKIGCKKLRTTNTNGEEVEGFKNGYRFMFYAKEPMSYNQFLGFFKIARNPIYSKKEDELSKSNSRQYLIATPQEQFLISTGKRFFKGYDDYDDLLRMIFDLETTGLNTRKDRIVQIGIRMNRPFNGHPDGFEKIISVTGNTEEEKDASELWAIDQMFRMIYEFRPDVITAHNGEAFDWNFIIDACTRLGVDIETMSSKYFKGESIRKEEKEAILKMGGEMEKFHRTIVPRITITDSYHAVRRAQATDSNFKQGDLKYSTKYLGLVKPNRVYTPGEKISEIWADETERYAFNDVDGNWYLYDPSAPSDDETSFKLGKDGDKPFIMYTRNYIADGYELKSGRYIIERYLLDDLWECDKVEYALNGTDFMLCKIIPVTYQRCCTMGTAGQWKAIMMAWSYEHDLAVPYAEDTGSFTGGLSRLLRTGFVGEWKDKDGATHGTKVIKLDYNSLYPSIILTWGIQDDNDLLGGTLKMLEYVLTTRETHKKAKKAAGKIIDALEERMNNGEVLSDEEMEEYKKQRSIYKVEDNRQAVVKKVGNSFFGAFGSNVGSVYPWKSVKCAEQTTCTGRQSLRLMISHFHNLGYEPIVGDSFTPDTPLFIKYENGMIDIKPIEELINENSIKIDALGREYDYSKKSYKVLCRSGWVEPSYIYRHKTEKDIYEISDGGMMIEVTEDHSLFNADKNKLSPKDIDRKTKLEYYGGEITKVRKDEIRSEWVVADAIDLAEGKTDRVHIQYLNNNPYNMKIFYETFIEHARDDIKYSKTCLAGLQYLKNCLSKK